MGKLDDVATDRLREQLTETADAKPAKRVMVALAYKDGVDVTTLSDRYGIPESTVYAWLDRFEKRSLPDAVSDDDRPGRPSKLTGDEREALEAALREPPSAAGYDDEAWTATLVQRYLDAEFAVSYSLGHIRDEFGDYLS